MGPHRGVPSRTGPAAGIDVEPGHLHIEAVLEGLEGPLLSDRSD